MCRKEQVIYILFFFSTDTWPFNLKVVKIGMKKKVEVHLWEKTGCVDYPSDSYKNRLECIRRNSVLKLDER